MKQDRETWIAARAHEIWEAEGRPHGQHDEHWRRAVEEHGAAEGVAKGRARTAPGRNVEGQKARTPVGAGKAKPAQPKSVKAAAETGKQKRGRTKANP